MSGSKVLAPLSVRALHNGNEPGITGVMPLRDDETRRIRDPVHGLIVFGGSGDSERDETDRIAWRLLDTREFQRLRRIRQLGFSDLVFPGATHSRFAHSVGVYHTARLLADVIARRQGRRDPERERVALLAALLHDIGHGPFSHVFESIHMSGEKKRHEDWGAEIVLGDTGVNRVLRDADDDLPQKISVILKDESPADIYASIVSSQFDADRMDYIQRDRMATGVEFAHIDQDWILNCLDVGSVTIDPEDPYEAPCFFLGPKGLDVAEEYLEARFRLFRMVYMHKTTRGAEKMLETLLKTAMKIKTAEAARGDRVLRYLTSDAPTLGMYLSLDDSAVQAALSVLAEYPYSRISGLATRLRDRQLYKCLDLGARDGPEGNLYSRFRKKLNESEISRRDEILFDDSEVTSYKRYDFGDSSALKKVLVKTRPDMSEPVDVIGPSEVVAALVQAQRRRLVRVYAPDAETVEQLQSLLREVENERR